MARIGPIGPGDLEVWVRMRCALWPESCKADLVREAKTYLAGTGPLEAVFVAQASGGAALGMLELSLRSYAEGCRSTPVPYIEGWYVMPEARGHGIGRALMAAAEEWARVRGHREIASDTLLDNRTSELAHRALGFVEVERAIHFRKNLARAPVPTPIDR